MGIQLLRGGKKNQHAGAVGHFDHRGMAPLYDFRQCCRSSDRQQLSVHHVTPNPVLSERGTALLCTHSFSKKGDTERVSKRLSVVDSHLLTQWLGGQ